MDTTKRSPLDRLLFATFLKGRTSSRDIWEEKGDMTPEDNQKIIEETNEIITDDSTYPYLSYLTNLLAKSKPSGDAVKKLHEHMCQNLCWFSLIMAISLPQRKKATSVMWMLPRSLWPF